MSTESSSAAAPALRPIVWRGYPLHFAIPVVIGLIGLVLLLAGGVAAFFGGWWMATAFPISIGGLFRDQRLIAVPAVFWTLWVVVGVIVGPDAALANTPVMLAVALAAIGSGALYLAQRAVFPATDPETLEAIVRQPRTLPTLEDAADSDPSIAALPVEDGEELDPSLAEAIEVAEETEPEAVLAVDVRSERDENTETTPVAEFEPEVAAEVEAEDVPEVDTEVEPDEPFDTIDQGQHPAEFPAITEEDLARAEAESSMPAASRAGRQTAKR